MNAKDYIFIDDKSIDGLYLQLREEIMKVKIPKVYSLENEMDALGGVSSVQNIINGQDDLSSKLEESTDSAGKVTFSYEQKINRIINICQKEPNYFTDLAAAIDCKRKSKSQMIVVNIYDIFRPKLNFSVDDSFQIVRDRGCLEFEKGKQPIEDKSRAYNLVNDSYIYEDDYYKQESYYIMLSLKLDKLQTTLSATSHMGLALRSCAGINRNGYLPLGVLGALRMFDDDLFQIKPYAVWM